MPARSSLCTLFLSAYPFKHHGRKKLVRFFASWLKTPMLRQGTYGLKYLLDPKNYIDARILSDGIYEQDTVEYFCQQVDRLGCKTFLDVGANLGVYSLSVLRTTKVERILAFEPDPRNRNQLGTSIFLNQADNLIEVHPEALSDKTGKTVLYAQRNDDLLCTGESSLEPLDVPHVEINVSTLAFDERYDWKDQKVAIKMDVEGHEGTTLKGMEQLIRNNMVFLQVEIFDENLEKIRQLLTGYGLRELPPTGDKQEDYYFTNAPT